MIFIQRFLYHVQRYWHLSLLSFFLAFISIIPIRMAIASYQAPLPQVIFTLGGGPEREKFTAEFAKDHPHLDIWVSSGIARGQALDIFNDAGVSSARIHLDYHAVDTVTNFTTVVKNFQQQHIQHIYLITSDFHLPRAKAIATIVLGSQGVTFTAVSIPSEKPKESIFHILRDTGRSLLWIVSGRTGASFNHISKNFFISPYNILCAF